MKTLLAILCLVSFVAVVASDVYVDGVKMNSDPDLSSTVSAATQAVYTAGVTASSNSAATIYAASNLTAILANNNAFTGKIQTMETNALRRIDTYGSTGDGSVSWIDLTGNLKLYSGTGGYVYLETGNGIGGWVEYVLQANGFYMPSGCDIYINSVPLASLYAPIGEPAAYGIATNIAYPVATNVVSGYGAILYAPKTQTLPICMNATLCPTNVLAWSYVSWGPFSYDVTLTKMFVQCGPSSTGTGVVYFCEMTSNTLTYVTNNTVIATTNATYDTTFGDATLNAGNVGMILLDGTATELTASNINVKVDGTFSYANP